MTDPPAAMPDESDLTLLKKDQCDAAAGSSSSKKQEERPCFCDYTCYYYTIKCEMCEYDTFFLCNRVTLDEVKRMKQFYCKLCLNKKKNKLTGLAITYKESDDDKGVDYRFNPCDLPHLHTICSFEGKKCGLRCFCTGGNCKPTFKIQCHRCKRFCHSECINMTLKESDRIKEFYCPPCCKEDPALQVKRVEPKKSVKKKRAISPSVPFVPQKRTRAAAKIEMKLKRETMGFIETVTLGSDTDAESRDSHSTTTTSAPSTETTNSAAQSRAVSEHPSEPVSPSAAAVFGQYFEEQLYSAAVPPANVDKEHQPCSSSSLGDGPTTASEPLAQERESSAVTKKNAASAPSKKKVSSNNSATKASAAAADGSVKRQKRKAPVKSVKKELADAIPYSVYLASKDGAAGVADVPPDGNAATAQPSSVRSASVDLTSAAPPQVPQAQSVAVVTADTHVEEASRSSSRNSATVNNRKASTTRLVSVKVEVVEAASQGTSSANRDRSNVVVELALLQAANQELRDKVDSLTKDLEAEKETTATLKELLIGKEIELAKLKKERAVSTDSLGACESDQSKDTLIQKLEKQVNEQAQLISRWSVRFGALEQEETLNNAA